MTWINAGIHFRVKEGFEGFQSKQCAMVLNVVASGYIWMEHIPMFWNKQYNNPTPCTEKKT